MLFASSTVRTLLFALLLAFNDTAENLACGRRPTLGRDNFISTLTMAGLF